MLFVYGNVLNKWYPRKRPDLQIEILKAIAANGYMSKRKAETELKPRAKYPVISDSFKALTEKGLIEKVTYKKNDEGYNNIEKFYKLTNNGLEVFINEKPNPGEFCKALIRFCRLKSSSHTTEDEFDRYYSLFESNYLEYSSRYGYFFYEFSMLIDRVFEKWYEDIVKENNGNDPIFSASLILPASQKVFESLALHRSVTFEELVRQVNVGIREDWYQYKIEKGTFDPESYKVADIIEKRNRDSIEKHDPNDKKSALRELLRLEDEDDIKEVLDKYTLPKNYLTSDDASDLNEIFGHDIDLIERLLIIKNDEGLYELSLFGIALVLNILLYYRSLEKFDVPLRNIVSLNRFYNYELEDYYEKIALEYPDKVPLIFGKWNQLKKDKRDKDQLSVVFNSLFNKTERLNAINTPFTMGGFKEQHSTIQALAGQTNDRLSRIHDDLQSALEEEEIHGYNYESMPIKLFYQKLTKLGAFIDLGNGNLRSFFGHSLWEEGSGIDYKDILKNKMGLIEDIYANELAFLFYLILSRPYHFGREDIAFKTFFPSHNKEPTIGQNITKEKSEWAMSNLSRVFKTDKDIRSWFFAKMQIIMDYQKRVHDSINEYYSINKHYQLIFRAH